MTKAGFIKAGRGGGGFVWLGHVRSSRGGFHTNMHLALALLLKMRKSTAPLFQLLGFQGGFES